MPSNKSHQRNTGVGLKSRNLSSGSSKAGLNLHFKTAVQKDVGKANGDKKKVGLSHDTNNGRNTSPHPRVNRAHSKEHVQQLHPHHRRSNLNPSTARSTAKPKKGFTITNDEDDDEDDDDEGEWISSESGAATPLKGDSDSDDDGDERGDEEGDTPVEKSRLDGLKDKLKGVEQQPRANTLVKNGSVQPLTQGLKDQIQEEVTTPTLEAQQPSMQQHQVQSQLYQQRQDQPPVQNQTKMLQKQYTAPPQLHYEQPTPPLRQGNHQRSGSDPTVVEARLGTASTALARHRTQRTNDRGDINNGGPTRRLPTLRPSSMHSTNGLPALRPHPLIRGTTYGQSGPPLTPLTAIQDIAPAQISISPPHLVQFPPVRKSPLSSPYLADISAGGSTSGPPHPAPHFPRRTSASSAKSVALPLHHSVYREQQPPLGPGLRSGRPRTLSTLSASSSVTALTSLVQQSTKDAASPRPTTPQTVAYFPVQDGKEQPSLKGAHPQLPAPCAAAHLTILGYRTPLRESYDRVVRAKLVG